MHLLILHGVRASFSWFGHVSSPTISTVLILDMQLTKASCTQLGHMRLVKNRQIELKSTTFFPHFNRFNLDPGLPLAQPEQE